MGTLGTADLLRHLRVGGGSFTISARALRIRTVRRSAQPQRSGAGLLCGFPWLPPWLVRGSDGDHARFKA